MAALTTVLWVSLSAVVLIRLVVVALGYLKFRRMELAIPGPPTLPLLGNALSFLRVSEDNILQLLFQPWDPHRHRGTYRLSLFNHMLFFVSDPEVLEDVARAKEFDDKDPFAYEAMREVLGDGLVPANGSRWKAHRKALEPSFHKTMLNAFVPIMQEAAGGFVSRVTVDQEQSVRDNLRWAALSAFLHTMLSDETVQKVAEPKMDLIIAAVDSIPRSFNDRVFNPLFWSKFVYYRLATNGRMVRKLIRGLNEVIRMALNNHKDERRNPAPEKGPIQTPRPAVCDAILEAEDLFSGQEMIDEFKTFVGAATDTTAVTLTWTMKMLSLRRDLQQRIMDEVDDIFHGSDRDLELDDLPRLQQMECFIKETMRLLPTVPMVARHVKERTVLGGFTIPAGTTLIVNCFGAHRDPKYWLDPLRFDPDRFLPENSVGRHPRAFLPFGLGPRNCIGGQYAMQNMKVILATVLRVFHIHPVNDGHTDPAAMPMTFDIASKEIGGTRLRFTLRQPSGESRHNSATHKWRSN